MTTPAVLSLGRLSPGQTGRGSVALGNAGGEPVDVARIETSCPCLRFEAGRFRVAPGGSNRAVVTFDPSDEPDFRGSLRIECRGFTDSGALAFRADVDVEVVNAGGLVSQVTTR